MRRLSIEWSVKDLNKVLKEQIEKTTADEKASKIIIEIQQQGLKVLEIFQKLKSFETLHILRLDQNGMAAIFRIEPKDPSINIEELVSSLLNDEIKAKIQLLEYENGGYTYFISGKLIQKSQAREFSMYPIPPFSFREGKARITLLGENNQVKKILEFMQKLGMNFRIVSLLDAKFSPSSPISRLTSKQREALILAFNLGYFDTPRKISSEELAKKLGLADSTLVVHLRRAERRLLAELLNE
jgi:predicted DNA binding protein